MGSEPEVSRHLACLKNAAWAEDRRCGVWMYYSIVDNGTILQESIMQSLREYLVGLEVAVADRERLLEMGKDSSCA